MVSTAHCSIAQFLTAVLLVVTAAMSGCGATAAPHGALEAGDPSSTNAATADPRRSSLALNQPAPAAKLVAEETETAHFPNGKVRITRGVKRYDDETLVSHGKYISYYISGQTFEEGHYIDGKRHGTWQHWHENGKVAKTENYLNGQLHGRWTLYNRDGTPEREVGYKNGKRHGRWLFYSSGKPEKQMEYREGVGHGKVITWHPNGQKKSEITFENNQPVGKRFQWYDNGQLAVEANTVDGKLHGTARAWNKNGKLISEIQYIAGKPVKEAGAPAREPSD